MKITVFGAGLVGSLYALLMAKLGHEVTIYEKRSDIRKGFRGRSRSINLALSHRGIEALKLAGIFENVQSLLIPMKGRMVHKVNQIPDLQLYSQYGDTINSISRNTLNQVLISEAEKTGSCKFIFNADLLPASHEQDMPKIELENGEIIEPKADFFMGTDGANSIARTYIKGNRWKVESISHSYKEIEIPSRNGEHQLFSNALHIWPRGEFMLIGLPNRDGSFTGTLFLPQKGENSFDSLRSDVEIKNFFAEKFPDVVDLIPNLLEEFNENPTSNLGTVWAEDWYDEEKKIGIIGDAAHGIVPFFGQGMNSGFEDCRLIFEALQTEDFENHFVKFAANRKKDTDAIARLSLDNFIEMRDLVANPDFLFKKKIDAKLQKLLPKEWIPQYSMVSFSNIPYSEVYQKGREQWDVLEKLAKLPDIQMILEDDDKLLRLISGI
jgi:kynurenine 3-monooxygenase